MSEFLQWFWQFNIEVTVLLVLILMARWALRRLMRTYNNYLLWLSIPLAVIVGKSLSAFEFSSPLAEPMVEQVQPIRTVVYDYVVQPSGQFDPWLAIGLTVLGLVALLLIRLVFQHWTLRRELRQISDHKTSSLSASFPVVTVNREGFSPAVYGFLKPKIYFPSELTSSLSGNQISLILQHEEQHIKQGHLWLNLFWDMLVCFLWFNPLVYFARQRFRHDQELYCDYLVLKNSDQHDRLNYGHALLSTVSATHSVSLLCSWKMFNQLEERIMNIKTTFNMQKKLSVALISAVLVCIASMYSLAMAGGGEQEKERIVIDKQEKRTIKLVNDEITYIEEDGERFVEVDGERRAMTDAEQAEYESLLGAVDIEGVTELEIDGAVPAPRRVVSVKRFHGGIDELEIADVLEQVEVIEELAVLENLDSLEALEALKELDVLSEIDIEILDAVSHSFSAAEQELEEALRSVERAKGKKNANKAELKRSAKELKEIKEQLAKDQQRMEKTREKARRAAKKARETIRRDAV